MEIKEKKKQSRNFGRLEKLAAVISEHYGVKLKEGNVCGTDGKNIIINSLPEDTKETLWQQKGFIFHEAEHIKSTEVGVMEKAKEVGKKKPWYTSILNALEDVRIEEISKQKFPGAGKYLNYVVDIGWERMNLPEDNPTIQLLKGLYLVGRGNEEEKINQLTPEVAEILNKEIKSGLRKKILECKKTSKVLNLVDDIWEKYKKFWLTSKEPKQQSGKDVEKTGVPTEGEREKVNMFTESIQKELNTEERQERQQEVKRVIQQDKEGRVKPKIEIPTATEEGADRYKEALEECYSDISCLYSGLVSLFKANEKTRYSGQFLSGRVLNQRKLWRFRTDYYKLLQKRIEPKFKSYAVSILADKSGSMAGSKIKEEFKAVIIQSEVLQTLNIPFEIITFTTNSYYDEKYGEPREQPIYQIIKSFGESYSSGVKSRLQAMFRNNRNNADGQALEFAWNRLKKYPAQRKILMVYSDGQPSCSCAVNGGEAVLMKKVQKEIEMMGQICVSIGVLYNGVERYYKNFIKIASIKELVQKTLGLLEKVLL